ncbi:MAG: hypothetical protein ACE5HJ_04095 [Thermoplasmata archaeon]
MACPKCQRLKGVRLEAKTTTCQCGKKLYIQRLKVLFSTEEPRELPEALGRLRAALSGHLEEFEEELERRVRTKASQDSATPHGPPSKGKLERALEALRSLSEQYDGFEMSQAEKVLQALDLKPSEVMGALLRENLLYETRKGVYRVL